MRNALLDVDRVQPWPGPIIRQRRVQQRAIVEWSGRDHPGLMVGDALGFASRNRDTPDIHVPGRQGLALDEVDIAPIRGPGQIVTVVARLIDEDASRISGIAIGDVDGISVEFVIGQHAPVRGPGHLDAPRDESSCRAADRRHQPIVVAALAVGDRQPYLGCIGGEPCIACGDAEEIRKAAVGQVLELARAHLRHPRVEWPVTV